MPQARPEIKAMKKIPLSFILALVSLLLAAGVAGAQDPTPPPATSAGAAITDDQVNAVAKQLYCPVCESTPLDVCPTQACTEWRELIREQLGQGMTAEEIKQYFVNRYGDRVLAAPPARGLNWLAYLVPPVAILAGAFLLFRAMRVWRKTPAPQPAASPDEDDDPYVKRLEEELKKM
jgi:cytochrome c-type biogenesis protein CcmH